MGCRRGLCNYRRHFYTLGKNHTQIRKGTTITTMYIYVFLQGFFMIHDDQSPFYYWFQMFEEKKKHALLEALEKIKAGEQPINSNVSPVCFVPPHQ